MVDTGCLAPVLRIGVGAPIGFGVPEAESVSHRSASDHQSAPAETADAVSSEQVTSTYQQHYTSLLRLAALLLNPTSDGANAEDVVQEAFIRVHSGRHRLREPEKLLAYLRQTVVNLSRSTVRRRLLGLRLLPKPAPDVASAEEGAYATLERDALVRSLRRLQRRQREVLVLRYFADLTESEAARTLGVSVGAVKAYGSRGLVALRELMAEEHG